MTLNFESEYEKELPFDAREWRKRYLHLRWIILAVLMRQK